MRTMVIDTTRIRGGHVADLLWMVTHENFDAQALGIERVLIKVGTQVHVADGMLLDCYFFSGPLEVLHKWRLEIDAVGGELYDGDVTTWAMENMRIPHKIR